MEDDPRMPTLAVADAGRRYDMGRMLAIFRADGDETGGRYSISSGGWNPGPVDRVPTLMTTTTFSTSSKER